MREEISSRSVGRRLRNERERERYRQQAAPIRRRATSGWRYVRKNVLKISKAKCARICGVSRGTVDRWEDLRSSSLPDTGHLGQLADELGYGLIAEAYLLLGLTEARR